MLGTQLSALRARTFLVYSGLRVRAEFAPPCADAPLQATLPHTTAVASLPRTDAARDS